MSSKAVIMSQNNKMFHQWAERPPAGPPTGPLAPTQPVGGNPFQGFRPAGGGLRNQPNLTILHFHNKLSCGTKY